MRRAAGVLLASAIAVVVSAHATVSPSTSRVGAYERYVLRVPNEAEVPTISVEIRFPAAVRVISFLDVPGWTLRATMDSTGRAISAVWTGNLPPERFVEFPFVGVNPESGTHVAWPVVQTYANGRQVEWTGPRGSDSPASVTEIGGAQSWRQWLPTLLAAAALLVAVLALARSRPVSA